MTTLKTFGVFIKTADMQHEKQFLSFIQAENVSKAVAEAKETRKGFEIGTTWRCERCFLTVKSKTSAPDLNLCIREVNMDTSDAGASGQW